MNLSSPGRIELSLTPLMHPANILCLEHSFVLSFNLEEPSLFSDILATCFQFTKSSFINKYLKTVKIAFQLDH